MKTGPPPFWKFNKYKNTNNPQSAVLSGGVVIGGVRGVVEGVVKKKKNGVSFQGETVHKRINALKKKRINTFSL